MGELFLCQREIASVPYFIESISLNVYSLEELCYYLKENIDLVDTSLMEEELISWIQTELKLTSLSEQLSRLKSEGKSLTEFVAALAAGCNYCTKEEIVHMQERLAAFENKSETECRKIRADRLLEKKMYNACILAYSRLLEQPEVTGLFAGNIYHNLGTAYAGLFLFEDAADCYGKAYEKNQNPRSLQQRQAAVNLAEGILPKENITAEKAKLLQPEEELKEWADAYLRSSR
ncbi:MAG: hypothetical protein HFJ04_11880 [Lachnospiraceae bacterium]|nr:hypothetical protein [Lachnospiraceae bacterium]